jgi:type II secretory pathway pseudopilin PulG
MMANTNYPSAENPQNQNRPVKSTNNTTKNIIIGVLAAGLLGTWAYFLYDKNDSNKQIQDKTFAVNAAMSSRDSLKAEYETTLERLDSLTGDNNTKAGTISDKAQRRGSQWRLARYSIAFGWRWPPPRSAPC